MSLQAKRLQKRPKKHTKYKLGCSNKVRYRREKDAKEALLGIRYFNLKKRGETDRVRTYPIRAYQCDSCGGGWHLTSHEDRYAISFELVA